MRAVGFDLLILPLPIRDGSMKDFWPLLERSRFPPCSSSQMRPPVNTAARPKAKVRNATRTVSGGVKQRAGGRPYALGYARNPSAEEFGANKRRFGFFARRRMVREGLLGPD